MRTLEKFGGAVLPDQIDLDRMMVKNGVMGDGAPMVRVVVGRNYGQNSDGTPKPLRAILEGWI